MKIALSLLILVCSLKVAATPQLRLGQVPAVITGAAPENADISAILSYSPDENPALSPRCRFEEDALTGVIDKSVAISAKRDDSRYALQFSMKANRENCPYHLSSIVLSLTTGRVFEVITMLSDFLASKQNLPQVDVNTMAPVYCDFETRGSGLCSIDQEVAVYAFSPNHQKIKIDFKDALH